MTATQITTGRCAAAMLARQPAGGRLRIRRVRLRASRRGPRPGPAWPIPVGRGVMNTKAALLAVAATAALLCGAAACAMAAGTPRLAPSRPVPVRPAPAVAFCLGGYPPGAPRHCGTEPAQIGVSGAPLIAVCVGAVAAPLVFVAATVVERVRGKSARTPSRRTG